MILYQTYDLGSIQKLYSHLYAFSKLPFSTSLTFILSFLECLEDLKVRPRWLKREEGTEYRHCE